MTTFADEMRQCLSEMQVASDKMKKLMDTPGIVWPELENNSTHPTFVFDSSLYKRVDNKDRSCDGCIFDVFTVKTKTGRNGGVRCAVMDNDITEPFFDCVPRGESMFKYKLRKS